MKAYTKEINDSHGDLVDLEFRCEECFDKPHPGYEYWYVDYRESVPSDFSADYNSYCKGCDVQLNDEEGCVG